jgi:hypothetical protein
MTKFRFVLLIFFGSMLYQNVMAECKKNQMSNTKKSVKIGAHFKDPTLHAPKTPNNDFHFSKDGWFEAENNSTFA